MTSLFNEGEAAKQIQHDDKKKKDESDNSGGQKAIQRIVIRNPSTPAKKIEKPKRGRPKRSKLSKPERKYVAAQTQSVSEEFKMPIKDLDFTQFETRLTRPQEVIDSYMASAENHPPIPLTRCPGNPIHRKPLGGSFTVKALIALGITEVNCYYVDVKDENDAFAKAVEFNSHHGTPLTLEEKKANAKKLLDKGFSQEDVAFTMGVTQGTVSNWKKQANKSDNSSEKSSQKRPRKNIKSNKKYSEPKKCAEILKEMAAKLVKSGIPKELIDRLELLAKELEETADKKVSVEKTPEDSIDIVSPNTTDNKSTNSDVDGDSGNEGDENQEIHPAVISIQSVASDFGTEASA